MTSDLASVGFAHGHNGDAINFDQYALLRSIVEVPMTLDAGANTMYLDDGCVYDDPEIVAMPTKPGDRWQPYVLGARVRSRP